MNQPVIEFTYEKATALQQQYDQAVKTGQNVFIFEGREVLTDYARYLLMYLRQEGLLTRIQ